MRTEVISFMLARPYPRLTEIRLFIMGEIPISPKFSFKE